jgi:hypothetical protein
MIESDRHLDSLTNHATSKLPKSDCGRVLETTTNVALVIKEENVYCRIPNEDKRWVLLKLARAILIAVDEMCENT